MWLVTNNFVEVRLNSSCHQKNGVVIYTVSRYDVFQSNFLVPESRNISTSQSVAQAHG
jgi:hypothetical protein